MSATATSQQKADKLALRDKQVKDAEELLGTMPQHLGFCKALYYGQFMADWVMPYPRITPGAKPNVDAKVAEVAKWVDEKLDPREIDQLQDIPKKYTDDLAAMGVLGLTAPASFGGHDFGQSDYCRILELIGGKCSATSIFVNAHHSIGVRALLLFGTPEQQKRFLPKMVAGEDIGAFALTEPMAGSDAANVQTQAVLSDDGSHYMLNGEKRYITNGAISKVLTVMARTAVPGRKDTQVTAFLVTPDMPGFEVVEARMPKLGIRGTATARLKFTNMKVPKENIVGPLGKGLKVALTVLDFGRTTFGACCTGAAKTTLRLAVEHATTRVQFNQKLMEFQLVQKKLAQMAAWTYAMEAMTYVTANLIDRGLEDYMLETAMLKVWSTEALWIMVNDSFQIYGGAAYFNDKPLERMLRDHRINQIGEGANEVLKSFIAMVGIKGPGERALGVWNSMKSFRFGPALRFGADLIGSHIGPPRIEVHNARLIPYAEGLAKLIQKFGNTLFRQLARHKEDLIDMQYQHERIADIAMELFACSCVLSRIDSDLSHSHEGNGSVDDALASAEFFLKSSFRKIRGWFVALKKNDDKECSAAAQAAIRVGKAMSEKLKNK